MVVPAMVSRFFGRMVSNRVLPVQTVTSELDMIL